MFRKREVWYLHHYKSYGNYAVAYMNKKEFDKVTKDSVIIEINNKQYTFLSTPIIPILICCHKKGERIEETKNPLI